jgi:nitrogen fixation protein FixH
VKYTLAFIAALAFAAPAAAQHSHGAQKGPNGGPVEDVAGVHAELVVSGTAVTLNILDEANKPLPSKGFTGSALVVTGAERETVTLAPSGDSALQGDAKKPVAKGAAISVTIKTAAGKSGQARFRM